jgi:hypothetical protein
LGAASKSGDEIELGKHLVAKRFTDPHPVEYERSKELLPNLYEHYENLREHKQKSMIAYVHDVGEFRTEEFKTVEQGDLENSEVETHQKEVDPKEVQVEVGMIQKEVTKKPTTEEVQNSEVQKPSENTKTEKWLYTYSIGFPEKAKSDSTSSEKGRKAFQEIIAKGEHGGEQWFDLKGNRGIADKHKEKNFLETVGALTFMGNDFETVEEALKSKLKRLK